MLDCFEKLLHILSKTKAKSNAIFPWYQKEAQLKIILWSFEDYPQNSISIILINSYLANNLFLKTSQ